MVKYVTILYDNYIKLKKRHYPDARDTEDNAEENLKKSNSSGVSSALSSRNLGPSAGNPAAPPSPAVVVDDGRGLAQGVEASGEGQPPTRPSLSPGHGDQSLPVRPASPAFSPSQNSHETQRGKSNHHRVHTIDSARSKAGTTSELAGKAPDDAAEQKAVISALPPRDDGGRSGEAEQRGRREERGAAASPVSDHSHLQAEAGHQHRQHQEDHPSLQHAAETGAPRDGQTDAQPPLGEQSHRTSVGLPPPLRPQYIPGRSGGSDTEVSETARFQSAAATPQSGGDLDGGDTPSRLPPLRGGGAPQGPFPPGSSPHSLDPGRFRTEGIETVGFGDSPSTRPLLVPGPGSGSGAGSGSVGGPTLPPSVLTEEYYRRQGRTPLPPPGRPEIEEEELSDTETTDDNNRKVGVKSKSSDTEKNKKKKNSGPDSDNKKQKKSSKLGMVNEANVKVSDMKLKQAELQAA